MLPSLAILAEPQVSLSYILYTELRPGQTKIHCLVWQTFDIRLGWHVCTFGHPWQHSWQTLIFQPTSKSKSIDSSLGERLSNKIFKVAKHTNIDKHCLTSRVCLSIFLLILWARLKLASQHFGGKNSEIKRAAIVEAVVIFTISRLEWPGEGLLFELDLKKRWGPKCSYYSSCPLCHYWSQVWGPLGQYCIYQETVSRRPEQVYLPLDQDCNDLERGHYLSRTRINAWDKSAATIRVIPGPLLKSDLRPLARYGTHQETIGGTPEQMYIPSDQDWIGPARRHYSSRTRINTGGRQNAARVRVIPWTITEVRPVALSQIWHPPGDHKWETWTEVSSISPKIGMACRGAIIQACMLS